MSSFRRFARVFLIAALGTLPFACERTDTPERTTFYQREIEPLVGSSCATSPTQSQCHVTADDRGNALGNLSVETYDDLALRQDLLVEYGPYGVPGFLLKALPPFQVRLTSWDGSEPKLITTDIAHVGGPLLDITSSGFTRLENWIRNGATENNVPPLEPSLERGPCSTNVGSDAAFDPSVEPSTDDYEAFDAVNDVIAKTCAAGNCHGSPANSLYLTCGGNDEQKRWNYFALSDYVAVETDSSELLRRTLAPNFGGTFHEGGVQFANTNDADYRSLRDWAAMKGGPSNIPTEAGFSFFEERVQPMLVKRGCMMLGCHSPTMFHDYRLHGGSAGHFGLAASRRNYDLSLEQLALGSPDPNQSRLLAKNLASDQGGIAHRGGPLFASSGDPAACDMDAAQNGPIDEQDPYCVIVAWIERERAERMAEARGFTDIVFVRRAVATDPEIPQDFETFRPGAEVVRVAVTSEVDGALSLGAETSLSAACGLDLATSDARRPAVSWNGERIAFAARGGANEPFRIYVVEGDSCVVEPAIDAPAVDESGNALPDNGELIHNFDPTFAPDGRIVFASTRGNVTNTAAFRYQGPQRSPADPSRLNANLYVLEGTRVRQLTFLLDQELTPSFMSDGRVIFTTEKRAPGFYQLAGRRQNLDGGDYHPLFAQRRTIGHRQMTDIVELPNKNLVAIFSDAGARHGSGALGIVNRSIGIDQHSPDESDYTVDASAIDFPNEAFFQHSLRFVDRGATGHLDATQGAYRSPAALPDGRILVSHAGAVTDLGNFDGGFDLVIVDPATGRRTTLLDEADDLLWPVAVHARQNHGVFQSRLDEANGSSRIVSSSSDAELLVVDMPILMSLLFQNTRTGRDIDSVAGPLEVFEVLPPEEGVRSFADGGEAVQSDEFGQVYVRRERLGMSLMQADRSVRLLLPGGVPITYGAMIRLEGEGSPTHHLVREQFQFYPGERARQGFPRELFNGLCGGCHGSVSGFENEIAANPDVLTRASDVLAKDEEPDDLR